jgi:hypothetical protein
MLIFVYMKFVQTNQQLFVVQIRAMIVRLNSTTRWIVKLIRVMKVSELNIDW